MGPEHREPPELTLPNAGVQGGRPLGALRLSPLGRRPSADWEGNPTARRQLRGSALGQTHKWTTLHLWVPWPGQPQRARPPQHGSFPCPAW